MSDPSTKWFKLWISSLGDPHLSNLPNQKFAQWVKLGVYVKGHGDKGTVILEPPSSFLCAVLQVPDFDALILCVSSLPNVSMRRLKNANDEISVSFKKWSKYQVDSTRFERNKRYRERQKEGAVRGEKEERKNKKRKEENKPPLPPLGDFDIFYKSYPRKVGKEKAKDAWIKLNPDKTLLETILKAIEVQKETDKWKEEDGKFIPYPATWLNGKRWEDEISETFDILKWKPKEDKQNVK